MDDLVANCDIERTLAQLSEDKYSDSEEVVSEIEVSLYESSDSSDDEEYEGDGWRWTSCLKMECPTNRKMRTVEILRYPQSNTRPYQVWDKWTEILPKAFNPGEFETVDEQLVAFRGRCPFRMYMPNKPARYGIKFWVLCDETSYVWSIQPYLGNTPGMAAEKNQGMRVVTDLTNGLRGQNVTVDNFFSSDQLGQILLQKNLTMIGTLKKNKPTIPKELLETKRVPPLTSKFAYTHDTTLVSYFLKKSKCVVLQSTFHLTDKVNASHPVKKAPDHFGL
ncbi:hypothetical protein WDU94_010780 [Cyamophila willieti]